MVARFERDFIVGAEVDANAFAWGFVPSDPRTWGPFAKITTGDSGVMQWADGFYTAQTPGRQFLVDGAQAFRAISACMQVYWPGKEIDRAGIISLARVNADVFTFNTTVAELRSNAHYVERMPAGMAEIVWRPNETDLQFTEVEGSRADTAIGKRLSGLMVTAAGYPANSGGVRIRVVVVYEWIPKQTLGFKLGTSSGSTGVTLGSVLHALDATGDWMYRASHAAGRAMSSLAAGVGGILSVGNGARRLGRAMLTL